MKVKNNILNMKFIKIVIISIILVGNHQLFSQQDAQYTQYMYNTTVVNPAYAGSRNTLSFNAIHRTQWVGIDGAPRTQTFSVHSPILNNLGMGLSLVNDKIGPVRETFAALDFSYSLPLNSEGTKLAFGLKGGANLLNVDFNQLVIQDPTELSFQQNINNKVMPIVGMGGYIYADKWYVGISTPNILKTKHYEEKQNFKASESLHFYTIAGYVFSINENIKLKPAALVKMVKGSPLSIDISANALFHEKFTFGAAYRWDASVSVLAGFQITEGLMIGYAYDFSTTELSKYNSGSHEIFLRFEIIKKVKRGKISPRFF